MVPLVELSGHADPPGETPWAMQLVARVEKSDPPTHRAVCEAAASAVVALLASELTAPGAPGHAAVQRWRAGRIRKHVRRARGAAWERAKALPGVTVARDGAEVRAFLPSALDEVPRDLARLQMQGLDLADAERLLRRDPSPEATPVVVSLCPLPVLATGKAAAAAGHAAQLAADRMAPGDLERWAATGFAVTVECPDEARWAELRASAPVVVTDAGFTDVAPGTVTALARWA